MEAATAVEKRNPRETALQRLARETAEFSAALFRMAILAALLLPLLLAGILTVDLPMRVFDGVFGPGLEARPSNWLTRGGFIVGLAPLLTILMARRFGGDEASRAVTAAWGLVAVAVFAELSYLAPQLEEGDLPSARFTMAFVASAMAAQYIAAAIYDVARGGGKWWRAPLYSAAGAAAAFSLIYFPWVYWGAGAPWLNWMVADFAIKIGVAFAFLPLYALVRKSLRPTGGFGGQ